MKLLRVRCIFYICTELQRYYYVSNIYVKIFIICYKFYLQGWKWCLDILRNIFPTCADECFAYRSKWNNSSSSGRYSWVYQTLCQCCVRKLFILGWLKESKRWFKNGGTYPRLYWLIYELCSNAWDNLQTSNKMQFSLSHS